MVTTIRWDTSLAVLFVYGTVLTSLISPARGLDISYCSPDNNANGQSYYNEFMSNGACQTHCQGSFAFAVIQGNNCWCSNYVPEPQQSTYDCNEQCPGFTSEWCGSTDAGLYGYFLLNAGVPLGTSGSGSGSSAPSSASPSKSTPSPTPSSVSIATSTFPSLSWSISVVTSDPDTGPTRSPPSSIDWPRSRTSSTLVTFGLSQSSVESSIATPFIADSTTSKSSTSQTPSPTPSSSTPTPTPSPAPSPTEAPTEVSTLVTTVTGEARTILVTPTPAASSDATLGQSSTGGGGGIKGGTVAGIVIGVVIAVLAAVGLGFCLWQRKKKRQVEEAAPESAFIARTGTTSPSNHLPSRQVSQLSSSGLLGTGPMLPRINTSGPLVGTDPRSADTTASGGYDRRSVATDQRLNPYALYMQQEGRASNVSLQDNHDYSRTLRVANPDQ